MKDAKAEDTTRQPEQIKAFRDTWQYGVHSYLTTLRDRLTVTRELLTESGSIFVQIGDGNVHLVRSVLDEIFGSENFLSLITFKKTAGATSDFLSGIVDYLLWYAKSIDKTKNRRLFLEKVIGGQGGGQYTWIEESNGSRRKASEMERETAPDDARIFRLDNLTSQSAGREKGEGAASWFPVKFENRDFRPTMQTRWKTNEAGMARLMAANRLSVVGNTLTYVRYLNDFPVFPINNLWEYTVTSGFSDPKTYVVQTSTKVIERCLLMTPDPGDLVLDPTCGSGTTAYVAEQWGRRWITIDTSRVALALARTRLMAARFPYYLLADSPEGRKKEAEITETPSGADAPPCQDDIRRGFVHKRVPHVTLKSIANNPDIKPGMTREKIAAVISKQADAEILYDQPYEDKGTVRVTGPFTVESLSPHRMLPTGSEGAPDQVVNVPRSADNYLTTILDNLRKAGVQNTVKKERLVFERLDAFPGEYVQAEGTFAEKGPSKGVRVSVGPEFGTVSPEWIKYAAKEAIKGSACELLLVCGFAFDPHVHEKTQELKQEMSFGKLRILAVRMNPDLAMGDELLKKTGSGNLFMVFGEPDLDIKKQKDGKLIVELRGVDVYDPTTGEVRSHSTDDVACWFIDTDYDGESFFVRHAYICGADEPYEKLKKALRAEIDEAEWAKLYSTTSLPFEVPKGGKIAVKVINHYGDEVLKVFRVP